MFLNRRECKRARRSVAQHRTTYFYICRAQTVFSNSNNCCETHQLAPQVPAANVLVPTSNRTQRPKTTAGRPRARTLERAATLTGVKIPFFAAATPKTQQQRSSLTALDDAFATAGLMTVSTAAGNPASMAKPPPLRTLLKVLTLLLVAAVRGPARLLKGWWWWCRLRQEVENWPLFIGRKS